MGQETAFSLVDALVAASRDPVHRLKALTALRGSEVWLATWPQDPESSRTLTNSEGVTALPVFSSERLLEEAAARYGWQGPSGLIARRRVSMPDAIRTAKVQLAQLVVVDITAEHVLELDGGELELLSAVPGQRSPSFEGLSVVSRSRPPEQGLSVKRMSLRASAPGLGEPIFELSSEPARSALKPSSETPTPDLGMVSATFGASPTATMSALPELPSDELFDGFTNVLREYPEVEWACVVQADRGHGLPGPSVALRVEPAFRRHLREIGEKLTALGTEFGETWEVLVLDTPEQMKQARGMGQPFYPWRKDVPKKR